jgi:hypothetical protein
VLDFESDFVESDFVSDFVSGVVEVAFSLSIAFFRDADG